MVIATRHLTAASPDGPFDVKIEIEAPELSERSWICRFTIAWPEGTRSDYCLGFDSVQALYLALQKIGAELYGSSYHRDGQLTWVKPQDGYGFPMIRGGLDVLIGEDRLRNS